jgi:hypothetical protein
MMTGRWPIFLSGVMTMSTRVSLATVTCWEADLYPWWFALTVSSLKKDSWWLSWLLG